jgi:hypothetical protein
LPFEFIHEGFVVRKWGVLITGFYAFVLLFVMEPVLMYLLTDTELYWWEAPWWIQEEFWPLYGWAAILVVGQALLLLVSVDTSFRRVQPRRHIGVAIATVTLMVGLLSGMMTLSIVAVIFGDEMFPDSDLVFVIEFFVPIAFFWAVWALVFRRYKVGDSTRLERLVNWLIKGSILELLIVVPCHVIVRNRDDCSAPGVTAYGIATGIAVMLLAFGPSVLFLYQKRLAQYGSRNSDGSSDE